MTDFALGSSQSRHLLAHPVLFGRRADLALSLGGALAGFSLVFLYRVLGIDMLLVWFVWVVLIDTPHFFASYFRTYLDREERGTSARLLLRSLAVFLMAPLVLVACGVLYRAGASGFRFPWMAFLNGVSVWAYWHILRQHYGILRLYQRKGGEDGTAAAKLESQVLYGCLILAFVALLLTHPDARSRLGLSGWTPIPPAVWAAPLTTLPTLKADQIAYLAALLASIALVARLAVLYAGRLRRAEPLALPKLVFLASVLLLHGVMGFSGLLSAASILGFTAVVTIYHDIQYFTVVWFYGRNRYGKAQDRVERFGLAGRLSCSFGRFFATALLTISLPLWGLGCLINRVPLCASGLDFGPPNFLGTTNAVLVFAWLTSGFQMHHYVLDQFIWRPSQSANLRRDLKLESRSLS